MKTYLALFIISTFSSLALTPVIRRVCERTGWLDEPQDERRVHERAMPRLGGVAIFISGMLAIAALSFVDNLITQSIYPYWSRLIVILAPATLIFALGVYDDLKGASAAFKFIFQALAATLFFVLGGRIQTLGIPFIGNVELPLLLSFALTLLWTIGVTNAFNLIDGMDGLAAGSALFASLVILGIALVFGHAMVAVIAIILSGALIGFLRYNFNPASIFLGDSGSLMLGFTLAALSIQGSQKASTAIAVAIPILTVGVPVIDTGFTLIRRFISGMPLLEGDREHIHHMLLERGWSQRRVAFVLYGASALLGLLALLFVGNSGGPTTGLLLFVIGVVVALVVGRLRYHEVDEVKASMRRNLGERRERAANNIRVRRASRALSKAGTLEEIVRAILTMLEPGEFIYVSVQLHCAVDPASHLETLKKLVTQQPLCTAKLQNGTICWSWQREGFDVEDVVGSGHYWTMHLPLTTAHGDWGHINFHRPFDSEHLRLDINYLCTFFRRELTLAAERVLSARPQEFSAQLDMRAIARN
ncbi:MAG TPA: MraY family glycosyltransferase [Pyrinomonadaceae bacterium]|jgi:UDP-GlcNAc:undecaprenyl-phosphate GlcNAc-1-phosphate transferase|nr:MraY family glycosyltransferase [Pyrinomonadaceae bacterium]